MLIPWQQLLDSANGPLLDAAAGVDSARPADLEGLRRRFDVALVPLALELTRARHKAVAKFGAEASASLVADVAGVEQASSRVVADHKAARFAGAGAATVHDLCCGIGGDAMSLDGVAEVVACDIDPVRAWMCSRNADCRSETADVTELEFASGAFWHLDPSRRDEESGRRSWRYEDYRPAPPFIAQLLATCPDGAVKLGPGVQLEALPHPDTTEIELISENGKLVQTVLWSGRLARAAGRRTATILPSGATLCGEPYTPRPNPGGGTDRHLFVADPAAERAGLLGVLADENGLVEVFPGLGLLTGASPATSPWLTGFEVHDVVPWRDKKIRHALRALDAGPVEVRTRGNAVDAVVARRRFQGAGSRPLVLFALRFGQRVRGVIASRLPKSDEAS